MTQEEEIIHVKSWMDLGDCNYEIDHDDDSIPESGVVYCNIEHIHKFFEKCGRTDNKYIVISGFSDYGVALQKEHPVANDMIKWLPFIENEIPNIGYSPLIIPTRCEVEKCKIEDKYSVKCYSNTYSTFSSIPNNIIKWFTVNPMIKDDRIVNIPLGVGKDAPSEIVEACLSESDLLKNSASDRVKMAYINWQDHTIERIRLKNALIRLDPAWGTIVREPKEYKDYLTDLMNHAFAICPEGNGVDCYRILECIYCGTIPIVTKKIAYQYLEGLPHVAIENWNDLSYEFLKSELDRIEKTEYNLDKCKLSYWKKQIEDERSRAWKGF